MLINRETTAIVVDSTADLPDHLANDANISMVPLTVYFGEDAYLDWVEMRPEEFYEKLAVAPALPRTSQPSAGAFLDEYKRLRERYERIYSVHLSGKFSGTCASAEVARSQIDGVTVVDSQLATGGIALLVDRMLDRVDRGVTEDEMNAYIEHFLTRRTFTFLPTTLDQLHKGGRIGHASHLVGTLLNIKPVLTIEDGVIEVYKKVRGLRQALEAMVAGMLEGTEPGSTCYASLSHGLNEPVLEQMHELLREVTDRDLQIRLTSVVGAVIGTYVGPGALALCCIQE